ncbi:MAG TPA: hypothetical protein VHH15_02190 [Actinophytocola sp.]|nr:hypothetical protein [Actinophytocola sp.]
MVGEVQFEPHDQLPYDEPGKSQRILRICPAQVERGGGKHLGNGGVPVRLEIDAGMWNLVQHRVQSRQEGGLSGAAKPFDDQHGLVLAAQRAIPFGPRHEILDELDYTFQSVDTVVPDRHVGTSLPLLDLKQ